MNTSDTLFPEETGQMLSPKARWLLEHGLDTWETKGEDKPWTCAPSCRKFPVGFPDLNKATFGEDEQEAIANYALKHGMKLWFEM